MKNVKGLIGMCGFYYGSCPDYRNNKCLGCRNCEHNCFTFSCVDMRGIEFCAECPDFPCQDLFTREKHTVWNIKWLEWKRSQRNAKQ